MLSRLLELNATKPPSRKAACLSQPFGVQGKLSWEFLYLSDAMEESEDVHRELRTLLQTEMVVRTLVACCNCHDSACDAPLRALAGVVWGAQLIVRECACRRWFGTVLKWPSMICGDWCVR